MNDQFRRPPYGNLADTYGYCVMDIIFEKDQGKGIQKVRRVKSYERFVCAAAETIK